MTTNNQEGKPLSDEVVDGLLANQRRRYLLYCLFRYTNPVTLNRVAECVTVWELHVPAEDLPKERLQVYMSLYHTHLPICKAVGVVTHAQAGNMVELTPTATQLKPYLKRAVEDDLAPTDREWEW